MPSARIHPDDLEPYVCPLSVRLCTKLLVAMQRVLGKETVLGGCCKAFALGFNRPYTVPPLLPYRREAPDLDAGNPWGKDKEHPDTGRMIAGLQPKRPMEKMGELLRSILEP